MDFSVLMPLSNLPERARACLESLERTVARRWRYEVILVGNDDSGTTSARLDGSRYRPLHRVLRPDPPLGHAASMNAAAKIAHAPVFCLLGPGTTLLPGWLEPMLRLLRREPQAGCVGNIHREPYSGLIDHAGLGFDANGLPVPIGSGEALLPREPSARRAAVSAACCVVSRVVFTRLGGFDESFQRRFDDVDFCLRASEMGYRHFVANRSVVYHQTAAMEANADLHLYRERWGDRARAYQRERAARVGEAAFSPENWETAREHRRQARQDLLDARRDGRRYLTKHLARPWRYNYGRVCRALVQTVHPLPAAIPRLPACFADDTADPGMSSPHRSDANLFNPPRQ